MNCPTCGCCAKENMANFKKFYYCGECKVEVIEKEVPPNRAKYGGGKPFYDFADLTPAEEAEWNEWLDSIHNIDDWEHA